MIKYELTFHRKLPRVPGNLRQRGEASLQNKSETVRELTQSWLMKTPHLAVVVLHLPRPKLESSGGSLFSFNL